MGSANYLSVNMGKHQHTLTNLFMALKVGNSSYDIYSSVFEIL